MPPCCAAWHTVAAHFPFPPFLSQICSRAPGWPAICWSVCLSHLSAFGIFQPFAAGEGLAQPWRGFWPAVPAPSAPASTVHRIFGRALTIFLRLTPELIAECERVVSKTFPACIAFHKPSFLQQLKNGSLEPSLVFGLLTCAARYVLLFFSRLSFLSVLGGCIHCPSPPAHFGDRTSGSGRPSGAPLLYHIFRT